MQNASMHWKEKVALINLNAKYKNVIAISTGEANLAMVISRAHLNPNRQKAGQLTI